MEINAAADELLVEESKVPHSWLLRGLDQKTTGYALIPLLHIKFSESNNSINFKKLLINDIFWKFIGLNWYKFPYTVIF